MRREATWQQLLAEHRRDPRTTTAQPHRLESDTCRDVGSSDNRSGGCLSRQITHSATTYERMRPPEQLGDPFPRREVRDLDARAEGPRLLGTIDAVRREGSAKVG